MKYSADELAIFRELYERSKAISKEERKQSIEKMSPFFRKINAVIRTTKELQVYMDLNLTETTQYVNSKVRKYGRISLIYS